MTTLASILPDKAAMLVYWAGVFGFTNVRICCDPNIEAFRILVSFDMTKKEHFSSALEALLTDKLGCYTAVLVESRLADLYVSFTLKQSVSLTKLDEVKKLYDVDSLEEVTFQKIPSEEDELYDVYVHSKKLAERILKKRNIPYNSSNPNTLFQDSSAREENPHPSSDKERAGTKWPNDSTTEQIIEKPNKIVLPPR